MDNNTAKPRFRKHPKPDSDVIDLLERSLTAARMGYSRAVLVIAINPVNQPTVEFCGELTSLRCNALLAGLAKAGFRIMKGGN